VPINFSRFLHVLVLCFLAGEVDIRGNTGKGTVRGGMKHETIFRMGEYERYTDYNSFFLCCRFLRTPNVFCPIFSSTTPQMTTQL
jgi:hypothetical protein